MKLVVGLGNKGKNYDNTYHNIGFCVLDEFAKQNNVKFTKTMCKADVAELFLNGEKILLAKPTTFMNLSGESVVALKNKFKIDTKDILVICDDIDLEKGNLRYRQNGSGGTHNGMRNIVLCLNTQDFQRIRIGIGRPENTNMDLADYVLSKIDENSKKQIAVAIEQATRLIGEHI